MRLITAALLAFMLMALCHGRSMRVPRQATLTDLLNDEDDLSNDPDWVPTEEDYYEEDGDDEEDDRFDRGTRQAKTAVGSTILEDPDDDVVNDPDWVPTADDYEDDYEYDEYDSDEDDDDNGDYDDDDSEEGDNPVDALWSSDDDPDWKPNNDEDEDEDDRLDEILFNIALLESGGSDVSSDKVSSVFQTLKELDLTNEEAAGFLYMLETAADKSENEIDTEAPSARESPVAAIVKSKRQVKSHRFSQATQDINQDRFQAQPIQAIGEIQESLPDQYSAGNLGSISYGGDYDQGQWGSGQGSQIGSINQASQGNQQDIATGVEPYYPQAVNPNEVASGVEPLDRGSESTGSSVINWFQRGWGHVVDTADRVGDKVEDTFSDWGDKIAGAASAAAGSARDVAHSAGESIVNTYHKVKGKIPELLEKIRGLFTKFGVLVQTGAEYYIQRMEETVDKVRQAEILDKLQQKLAEGNEQVTLFFQTLGEKCSRWTQTHGHENVDAGLITIQQVHPEEGVVGEDIVQVGGQQTMPNWFQDEEVIEQLNQMMNSGIIEQSDLDFLSQQTRQEAAGAATPTGTRQDQNQPQQNQQSPPSSPISQSQNSGSRRALRALIDALMVH